MQADRFPRIFAAGIAAIGLAFAVDAQARELTIRSSEDVAEISSFTLDFGKFGEADGDAARVGVISSTRMTLKVDPDTSTAAVTSYVQRVEPITLPGGFSTGEITVTIVPGSSTGTFDAETGLYQTDEVYAIFFDGDLSLFGLESPLLLPSSSDGIVSFDGSFKGQVDMEWIGGGTIGEGEFAIDFGYTCAVHNQFKATAATLVRIGLIPELDGLGLAPELAELLNASLNDAYESYNALNVSGSARALRTFIGDVRDALDADMIDAESADYLIDGAQTAIDSMIRKFQQEHRNYRRLR